MLQVLLSGLAIGAIYGLVGMGYAIGFYVTRAINFALGSVMMVSMMVASAVGFGGGPPLLAAVIGVAASGVAGAVTYLIGIRPVLAFNRLSFAWLVTTLGLSLIIESIAALIWGDSSRAFPGLLSHSNVAIGSASISVLQLITIGLALLVGITFETVRRRTLLGKIGMAVAADPEMASAVGINTRRVALAAFGLAGLLAGLAGVLIAPITFANPYIGETYGISGFIALMIGGTERPVAALVGGLILGILDQAANTLINSQASDWFPLGVIAVMLLLLPEGLWSFRLMPPGALSEIWANRRGRTA